jgi:hypothetical protein
MISLSLTCRGLDNPSKKKALKRLMEMHRPDILFLQETMGSGGYLLLIWRILLRDGNLLLLIKGVRREVLFQNGHQEPFHTPILFLLNQASVQFYTPSSLVRS